jgi:hypothetical protein
MRLILEPPIDWYTERKFLAEVAKKEPISTLYN